MTTPFYAPPSCFSRTRIVLPADEARHAVRVLRLQVEDEIVVVDGAGGWHRARIVETGRDAAAAEIIETRRDPAPRQVMLALGLLQHRDRFEWAVEKAVELGATGVLPLRTQRAAPGRFRAERLQNIAVAAMKQSLRTRLPAIYPEMRLGDALALARQHALQPLIAHEAAADAAVPSTTASSGGVLVLIGPEGGFTDAEVDEAVAAGATLASLGPHRLRAETAAVTALADLLLHA